MSDREVIEQATRAIAEFATLPPQEQVRRLVAAGAINEKGEVLMGGVEENGEDRPNENGSGKCPQE